MTVRETLVPSAMVPGLVTVKGKDGKQQNVYPIDAKELINSGEFELVENGAIEAARMAATPLRSGMAAGIPGDNVVVEVSGIEGRVVATSDAGEAEKLRNAAADGEGTGPDENAPKMGAAADREKAKQSAEQSKTEAEKKAAEQKAGGAERK